jgi:hypothetical protein
MPFVKLDCGILSSTLWVDRPGREVFITALLMAEPKEVIEPLPQIATDTLDYTGFVVPPGWYGWVDAAGVGIVGRAGVERDVGIESLKRLASPDPESRSKAFEGRRLVRVDGGYVVLNFMEYRDRDYTSAERSKRWRERQRAKRHAVSTVTVNDTTRETVSSHRDITQAEAEAYTERSRSKHFTEPTPRPSPPASLRKERSATAIPLDFAEFWKVYPNKTGKGAALKAWTKHTPTLSAVLKALDWQTRQSAWTKDNGQFIPHPATWLNRQGWEDEPFHTPQPTSHTQVDWKAECAIIHHGACHTRHYHELMAKPEQDVR